MTIELQTVYRMPSGHFAQLVNITADGDWVLQKVNPSTTENIPEGGLHMSPRAALRLAVAWHPHEWALKSKARKLHEQRIEEAGGHKAHKTHHRAHDSKGIR